MPAAFADPSPPGFRPMFQGNLPRTVAKASLKTTDKRFPLDHP
jgi:hypothetical protein